MRIHVDGPEMVNWDEVHKKVTAEAQAMATKVVEEAQAVLSQLKPGEKRTLTLKVGSVTVSRPK